MLSDEGREQSPEQSESRADDLPDDGGMPLISTLPGYPILPGDDDTLVLLGPSEQAPAATDLPGAPTGNAGAPEVAPDPAEGEPPLP
jgi:hypothetical protein